MLQSVDDSTPRRVDSSARRRLISIEAVQVTLLSLRLMEEQVLSTHQEQQESVVVHEV